MDQIREGRYAYRFKGFAQDPNSMEYFLVGVGTLDVSAGNTVSGEHRSTYLRLSRGRRVPTDGRFQVTGSITAWDATSHSGSAKLVFTELDATAQTMQVLTGHFALVQAGANEYWLTSYGGADVVFGSQAAIKGSELVEGELRWISV